MPLEEFIVRVIQLHHSTKNNEAELASARELYAILPSDIKRQIAATIPSVAETPNVATHPQTFFSWADKPSRNILIYGDTKFILRYQGLINYLDENNITGEHILRIEVKADQIKISTAQEVGVKNYLRDELFIKQLGAVITDNPTRYEFIVRNPDKLRCMSMEKGLTPPR
jgi:hypothetical protein